MFVQICTSVCFLALLQFSAWTFKSPTLFLSAGWLSSKHHQVGKGWFRSCVQITAAAAVVRLLAWPALPPVHEQLAHPAVGPEQHSTSRVRTLS